ncbi:beta-ketoacyl-[acyl-carrier-protein] synthase family protein [Streptomyces ureilyticus]|uniref:Beta-ketoacyl-[acyl-carrier-protein] synthase family protein n=1 Tax=Streptomyces ureilyticus TaxID=1775131 RepID=A0ABX0E0J7_9ACTN|nr:beta-ketoacyl-[acyl-carrier-protein] synthase family protein [Streptomyces ureilyticus]NGO45829.1 beta-ketoacyl-[acyl-carrier-protein] synthase family protein [Streptomyces ureilyticus]
MTLPVAVTGVGSVTPLGVGAAVLASRLVAGETALVGGDGRCVEFDAGEFLTRRESRRNARFAQLALVAADEAVHQAGWSNGLPYPPEEILCIVGTGLGGAPESPQGTDATPLTVPLMMANSAAASLCTRYGIRGESFATSGACAAGAQAIGVAMGAIRRGEAAAAVVGGAEAASVPLICESFAQAGALSPTGRCVPFGADRDGFVMGEGAGILVLESVAGARARGAEILGLVMGYGASSDAHHVTAPSPDGVPAAQAMRRALADAGVAPEDLCYINTHGTGTPLNDEAEIRSLRLALGDALASIPLSSTKAATGHLFGAGGAVESIITLAALRGGTAPPTYGLSEPDRRLGELDHVLSARALKPGPSGVIGLSDSLGFGGHNSVLVLGAP